MSSNSSKNCCRGLFEHFDLFGEKNYLRYNKRQSYKTCIGGFLSLIMILLFIAIILYKAYKSLFSIELYVQQQDFLDIDPTLIKLRSDAFMFAVQIEDANFINSPYYSLILMQK